MNKSELIENIEILIEKCASLQRERDEAIKERDYARRLACREMSNEHFSPEEVASIQDWGCYKERGNQVEKY